ncbi:hypothetical protein [Oricola thermophila]|uniref:Uncharacterized protein n=1 Tax=Oricola thermophila TaxID=2742145 RepID=A0A6N1VCH0_9HYPH|nr:hypothetical protein [Oricola thermophila]QKV18751.1 hypothetical protein HTY61_09960 [Oricola thermophila]
MRITIPDRYMRRRIIRAWRVARAILFGQYHANVWDGEADCIEYLYQGKVWRVPDTFSGMGRCPGSVRGSAERLRLQTTQATDAAFVSIQRPLVERVRDIKADIAEFDGDRRGMYAALEDAERELISAALNSIEQDERRRQ